MKFSKVILLEHLSEELVRLLHPQKCYDEWPVYWPLTVTSDPRNYWNQLLIQLNLIAGITDCHTTEGVKCARHKNLFEFLRYHIIDFFT